MYAKLLQDINVNIWKNSYAVKNWFQNIKNKNNKPFITFDICDFYPSITEDLLCKALSCASHFTNIPTEHQEIILHSKKSILISNGEQRKKNRTVILMSIWKAMTVPKPASYWNLPT